MSKTFKFKKPENPKPRTVYISSITVIPPENSLVFHDNTEHNFKGLSNFFSIVKKTGSQDNQRFSFEIEQNHTDKEVTLKGDSMLVIKLLKRLDLIDINIADEMLDYLDTSSKPDIKCSTM